MKKLSTTTWSDGVHRPMLIEKWSVTTGLYGDVPRDAFQEGPKGGEDHLQACIDFVGTECSEYKLPASWEAHRSAKSSNVIVTRYSNIVSPASDKPQDAMLFAPQERANERRLFDDLIDACAAIIKKSIDWASFKKIVRKHEEARKWKV